MDRSHTEEKVKESGIRLRHYKKVEQSRVLQWASAQLSSPQSVQLWNRSGLLKASTF